MPRRRSAPLAFATLALGLFAAAGPASASAAPQVAHRRLTTNWSGYAKIGGRGGFRRVSASWRQPVVHCRSMPPGQRQYADFWVGLDGFDRNRDENVVEQTGIQAECDGTTASYKGWYSMDPSPAVAYSYTVEPGDLISASVTFSGRDKYALVLTDHTRGWRKVTVKHSRGRLRSSAEVITQAPGGFPLAHFGKVTFTGAATSTPFTNRANRILMVNGHGRQLDSTSSIGRGSFSIQWIRSS